MDRVFKGHGMKTHVSDYCVVDLETTGVFIRSARIIEISAIKVRDDRVSGEYSVLINPGCPIPPDATAVNNITDGMVKDCPGIDEVIDSFAAFIGDDVIIGYNNASFDMNLLYDARMELRGLPFSNNYIDVLYASRKCLPQLDNHRLETVSKYYALDTAGEHRGLKDCYLTKSVYDCIYRDFGSRMFGGKGSGRRHVVRYSAETLVQQELQSILGELIADGEISQEEFEKLKAWMEEHRDLQGSYPFDRVFDALDKVLQDGRVAAEELQELQQLFTDFVDPVKSRARREAISTVAGMHIILTGDFSYGSKDDVFALIEAAGGIIDKSVKKATNFVVVGAMGSESWKTGNYGSKIQKAIELQDKGLPVEIIEEQDFIPALQRILEAAAAEKKDSIPETETAVEVNWQQDIRDMLEELVKKYELPPGSLYLADNYGQVAKDKLVSHAVCIWEPDYPPTPYEKPAQNKIIASIVPSTAQIRPNDLDIYLRETQEGDLHAFLPEDAEALAQTKSDRDTGTVRVRMKKYSPNLTEYIRRHAIYCIEGYESKAARFGCCSAFEKCSDAKRCVHKNKLYAKACMYRDNLDQGRIFYGKNRNSDHRGKIQKQEVKLGSETVILDSEKEYTGMEKPSDEEKQIRRAVSLPVTKQLIYYKDKRDAESAVNVQTYRLAEMYNLTERWYIIEVTLEDGTKEKIHSDYLAEMQKPSFIADMAAQIV